MYETIRDQCVILFGTTGLLSSALMKSAFEPPQQIIVASPPVTLHDCDVRTTKFLDGGTSFSKKATDIQTSWFSSEKPTLNVRRRDSTENSIQYASSMAITDIKCLINRTKR